MSIVDVLSPTVGPRRPRSPERRASQQGPRDTVEDRPGIGPPEDRSHLSDGAVQRDAERRSSRNSATSEVGAYEQSSRRSETTEYEMK